MNLFPSDPTALQVSRAELIALIAFSSKDETHVYSCVQFDTGSLTANATDGHRALRGVSTGAGATDGAGVIFLVSRAELARVVKMARRRDRIRLTASGATVYEDRSQQVKRAEIPFDGTSRLVFPSLDYVISELRLDHAGVPATFNPSYLADLRLVCDAAEDEYEPAPRTVKGAPPRVAAGITLFPPESAAGGGGDPMGAVVSNDYVTWTAVIMPLRSGSPRVTLSDCSNVPHVREMWPAQAPTPGTSKPSPSGNVITFRRPR